MKITDDKKAVGIITARKETGGYPFLDFDDCTYLEVAEEARKIIEEFKIGDCIISKTGKKHYHGIYFWSNQSSWARVVEIVGYSSLVHSKFKEMIKVNNSLRLRIAGKKLERIKIVGTAKSPYHKPNPKGDADFRHYKRLVRKLGRKHG